MRGHIRPSHEGDPPNTEKWREKEEEGLKRVEDSELVFWETSFISVVLFYYIGMLEWKFTLNPSLTS